MGEQLDDFSDLVIDTEEGPVKLGDLVEALFDHIFNLQQFIYEHGHTEEQFGAWLREYERRELN